jgi:hypothetical protein
MRWSIFELCYQVAEATNGLNPREAAFLEKVAQRLEVPFAPSACEPPVSEPAPLPEEKGTPAAPRERQLALLEIDPSAPPSADLIRRRHRLLQARYTPEKLQAMGPEFVDLARAKQEAIRAAAAALLQELGEKLEADAPPAPPPGLRPNADLDALFGV